METKNNKELCAYVQPETEVLAIETGSILQNSQLEPGQDDEF
jgi:hypothetical protein